MASNRKQLAHLPTGEDCASASGGPPEQMLEETAKRVEQEGAKREKGSRQDPTAPRAGRTGGLGARAERPSEGRQPLEQPASGPRGGKPPAPRACSEK
jgi:hypothetical protein